MNILTTVNLVILVFLATSSGITKVILMPQDVEFYGNYGFTNPILILFGASQLIGGVMLIIKKTRFAGAVLVAITFAISTVVLIMAQKTGFTIVTVITLLMLGVVMKQSIAEKRLNRPNATTV